MKASKVRHRLDGRSVTRHCPKKSADALLSSIPESGAARVSDEPRWQPTTSDSTVGGIAPGLQKGACVNPRSCLTVALSGLRGYTWSLVAAER